MLLSKCEKCFRRESHSLILSDERGLELWNVIFLLQAVSFCGKAVRISSVIQHWPVLPTKLDDKIVFLYA